MFVDVFNRWVPPLRRRSQCRKGGVLGALVGALVVSMTALPNAASASNGHVKSPDGDGKNSTQSLVAKLPASVRGLYTNITEPVIPSPYATFTPPKPPWKLCFEDAYEGNEWRISVRTQLAHLSSLFKAKHLVTSFSYSVSDDTPTLENSQLRAFIDKGCSLILLTAESATGDNGSIAAAYKKGIPVVAFNNYVTSPYAQVVDQPWYQWGAYQARQIAKDLHGHGTVIMLTGIAGETVAVGENKGADAVWKKYPGIKVIPAVGDWTATTTSSAITQVLATHPGSINAVWTTGSEAWYVAQDFKQAGRPIPIITSSPAGNTLALAKGDRSIASKLWGEATLPVPIADYGFDTAIRILSGEHPIVSPIMFPLSQWSGAALKGWYASCMTQKAGENPFPIPPAAPLSTGQMNAYFTNGHAVAPYSYAGTLPKACS